MDQAEQPLCIASAVVRSFFGDQLDRTIHLAELYPSTSKHPLPRWMTLCGVEFAKNAYDEQVVCIEESELVSDCLPCRRVQRDTPLIDR